jgi:hypothetical protein
MWRRQFVNLLPEFELISTAFLSYSPVRMIVPSKIAASLSISCDQIMFILCRQNLSVFVVKSDGDACLPFAPPLLAEQADAAALSSPQTRGVRKSKVLERRTSLQHSSLSVVLALYSRERTLDLDPSLHLA